MANITNPLRERLTEMAGGDTPLIFFDPPEMFDNAIIGLGRRIGMEQVVVYDETKVLANHAADFAADPECEDPETTAMEWFEFNTIGSWVGEYTPLFVVPLED